MTVATRRKLFHLLRLYIIYVGYKGNMAKVPVQLISVFTRNLESQSTEQAKTTEESTHDAVEYLEWPFSLGEDMVEYVSSSIRYHSLIFCNPPGLKQQPMLNMKPWPPNGELWMAK